MATVIIPDPEPTPAESAATAETLRLAEEAGRAAATAAGASADAAEAQRTAEAAAAAAAAAMTGQIVTVDMMTAQAGEIAALRAELTTLAEQVTALLDDDAEEEGDVTPVIPAPKPETTPAKPKDQTGLLTGMLFR